MGSINSILSSMVSSSGAASAGKTSNKSSSVGNPNGVYGSAYQINVSQQTNDDGSHSDTVTYTSYDGTLGSATTTIASGSGSDFKSAFESMLDMLDKNTGADPKGDSALDKSYNDLSSQLDAGGATATASTTEGGLLSEVGAPFGAQSGSGTASALASVEKLVDDIINSLRDNLNKKGVDMGTNVSAFVTAHEVQST